MKKPLTALSIAIICFGCGYRYDHMGYDGHMMPYGGLGMWILLIIAIGAVIYIVFQKGGFKQETPLDILKRRYANGEITKEEFENMKKDIGGH